MGLEGDEGGRGGAVEGGIDAEGFEALEEGFGEGALGRRFGDGVERREEIVGQEPSEQRKKERPRLVGDAEAFDEREGPLDFVKARGV